MKEVKYLNIELMEHQKQQIKDGLNGKNINQSEAGSGKTFVGLGIFKESNYTKLLVVCLAPKVQDFHEDGKLMDIDITPLNKGTKKNKELLKSADNVAIGFESSWRLKELLHWVDKDTMILIDESHRVKSPQTKVSYFLEQLSKKVAYVYLMTATFITNQKYEDSYQQLKIAKLFNGTYKDFKKQYCIEELESIKVRGRTQYFNKIVGYTNTEQLEKIIQERSVFKKRDIADNLIPEDIYYYVKKPTMYNKVLKKRMVELPNGEIVEYDNLPKLRHALLQLSSGCLKGVDKPLNNEKVDRLRQILTQHNSERVVVFYNYDSELAIIKQVVESEGLVFSEYNGHRKNIEGFKEKGGVVAVQFKSGSTGINDLVLSNVTVYYGSPDSSTVYIQSKARTNRYGQTNKCLYYHLICKNSVESKAFEVVQSGEDFTNEMLEKYLKEI